MKKPKLILSSIIFLILFITSVTNSQTALNGNWSGTLTIRKPAYGAPRTLLTLKVNLDFETNNGRYENASTGKKDFDFQIVKNNEKNELEILVDIPELDLEETYFRPIDYGANKIKLEGIKKKMTSPLEIIMEITKDNN